MASDQVVLVQACKPCEQCNSEDPNGWEDRECVFPSM